MSRSRNKSKTDKRQLAPNNCNDSSALPRAPYNFDGPLNTPDNLMISVIENQQRTIDGQQKTIDKLIESKQTPSPPKWAQLLGYGYPVAIVVLALIALSYFLHGRYPESTASEDLAKMALSTLLALVVGMAKGSLPGSK